MPTPYKSNKDVKLYNMQSNDQVYWSPRKNSYILVFSDRGLWQHKEGRVNLYSVNGIGEIRWDVAPSTWHYMGPDSGFGGEGAVEYFGLKPVEKT